MGCYWAGGHTTSTGRRLPFSTPSATEPSAFAVKPGRVFVTNQEALYEQSRRFAPVECAGKTTWVSWAATRLESVVAVQEGAPVIYQVMDVMCDTPFIDDRPYVWGGPLPLDRRHSAGCGRMPS